MSTLKAIRDLLGKPSQEEVGKAIGVTQGSIGFYERGTITLPVDRAERLITFAASRGLRLTLDQVYGRKPLPREKAKA
jgi:putative transcriptional regulator